MSNIIGPTTHTIDSEITKPVKNISWNMDVYPEKDMKSPAVVSCEKDMPIWSTGYASEYLNMV